MNAIFKTFAKLADVAKLHKSGAKSEPTTCAEEQVNHYRSPKDAVNKGEKNLACISLLLPVAMTFLCKRYQLFKKYIRYEVLDNFCVAYMRFCIKMAGDINAVSEIETVSPGDNRLVGGCADVAS